MRKYNLGEIKKLVDAYDSGASLLSISAEFGIAMGTARRVLVENDVLMRTQGPMRGSDRTTVIRALLKSEPSLAEIARMVSVSREFVRQIQKREAAGYYGETAGQ